ncbi:hypothetical protein VE03_05736 [Pseudogymnoascus sp. 23342-1-I1]|nr:hypothetical protein VE03_05736 [Pseudogymnoascus sp. 23342-1-I1]
MAVSSLRLSSALCLVIALLLTPTTAHKPQVTVYTTVTQCPTDTPPSNTLPTKTPPTITPPTATPSTTVEPPTKCLTITSTTTPATCPTCSIIACPAIAIQETQPCGCPSAIPTVYEETGCCPGCIVPTFVTTATGCATTPPPPPCAVITSTVPPACPSISGCMVPDCVFLETLTMGCECAGVSTVTACDGKCPGCWTEYVTEHVPCPTRPSVPQ